MQNNLKELIKAVLSNPGFDFIHGPEVIKNNLNAIKEFYSEASKTDTSPENF